MVQNQVIAGMERENNAIVSLVEGTILIIEYKSKRNALVQDKKLTRLREALPCMD